ncbi:MAG: phosphoribosylamine--glycine ligase [Syntrophothermus sp.]
MNVLVIGSGGREHAISQKIGMSSKLDKLFIIPGNPGTSGIGENIPLNMLNNQEVLDFCFSKAIDLVVIGPEMPLVNDLASVLRENNIRVFGPDAAAAAIEGDKAFAKELMQKYNIPTAAFRIFKKTDYETALSYTAAISYPVVIKASGLAAGKGVLICMNREEAEAALKECFDDEVFGQAGDTIVIEDFMQGREASIFAVTDGQNFICLPAAQDHKRIGDNDTGKNTGGMGAYAPAPLVTPGIMETVEESIIIPTLAAMEKEGRKFVGCLYCGIMITSEGPKVVEFNCRFGDPETQAVLQLLDGDFLQLLYSAADGVLDKASVIYNGGSAVTVVLAAKGYPDQYPKGMEITGLDAITDPDVKVFHAGTKQAGAKVFTNGGRVLNVTAFIPENDLNKCREKAYNAVQTICFDDMYFRTDIAARI